VALKRKMEDIASQEMKKTLGSMTSLSESDMSAIKRMTDAMISKIMHDPILFLKDKRHHVNESAYLNMTRNLFNLDRDLE
jgi:glutamyl-tRNA reductase